MKKLFFKTLMLFLTMNLFAQNIPEWIFPLRDAVYEQRLNANQIKQIYTDAQNTSKERLSGTALDIALSRCEYFMGRALLFEERNQEAKLHFEEGLRLAENAVNAAPSSQAWVMRAENLSFLCQINPLSFAMANGLNIERFAKNALRFDERNAAAQYMIAARWVYAPAPLHNHNKGIEMMKAIITNGDMQKDDRFNVYSAIGYAYLQRKNISEATLWLQRSLEIYPTNKFVTGLINNIK